MTATLGKTVISIEKLATLHPYKKQGHLKFNHHFLKSISKRFFALNSWQAKENSRFFSAAYYYLPFDLEIGFNLVFRPGAHEYRNKNSCDVGLHLLRVYTSIFRKKNTNLSQYLEIGFNLVFRHMEHEYRDKKIV